MFKKSLLLAAIAAGLMSMTALADSYAHLESNSGTIDILGVELYQTDGKNYAVILAQFENTTSESKEPTDNISITVYQNGVEMEYGYVYNYKAPEGYLSSSTKVRHGATMNFYRIFELTDAVNPIDIEVDAYWEDKMVECTLALDSELADSSDNTYTTGELTEAVPNPYEERIAALEALVADLTARIEALESK